MFALFVGIAAMVTYFYGYAPIKTHNIKKNDSQAR